MDRKSKFRILYGPELLLFRGEKRGVDQGSAYIVPSNVKHSSRCLESPAEIIETFSPPREDLIEKIRQA